jgi:hypothetical protein
MDPMDHADARELLELAAAEPGGLDRLMAGDTRDATVLAAHLAGCSDCTIELERIRRVSAIVRDAVRDAPAPELKQRTLAYVRELGRARGAEPAAAPAAAAAFGAGTMPARPVPAAPDPVTVPVAASSRARGFAWPSLLGTAVALVLIFAVAGTSAFVALSVQSEMESQRETAAALGRVSTWTLRIDGAPDSRRVELSDSGTGNTEGTLVFSPASGELVIVATGLREPAGGAVYRCWVDVDGERRMVGRMFFGGGIAYWAGRVDDLGTLEDGATFGVGLVEAGGSLDGASAELDGVL